MMLLELAATLVAWFLCLVNAVFAYMDGRYKAGGWWVGAVVLLLWLIIRLLQQL